MDEPAPPELTHAMGELTPKAAHGPEERVGAEVQCREVCREGKHVEGKIVGERKKAKGRN
jgi:hypothetical protein